MNAFNGEDYDFAAGSIKGLRSWSIDALGRLHGVTHHEVWTPGDNVSVCKATRKVPCPEATKKKVKRDSGSYSLRPSIYSSDRFFSEYGSCGEPTCSSGTHDAASEHTFDPNCQCGFWAYDESAFTPHGDVTGVIEGYGKTTIGTKGFRCEKARIVALARDNGDATLTLSRWLRLQQLYPEAKFYDELEEMVSKHGGVLKVWEPVGEDFWTRKAPEPEGEYASLLRKFSTLYGVPSSAFGSIGPRFVP